MIWLLIIGVVLEAIFIAILLWVAKVLTQGVRSLEAAHKQLSDSIERQTRREQEDDAQNQALLEQYNNRGVPGGLPVSLLTEAMLARRKLVEPTLSGLIEEASVGLGAAIQNKDYQRSESILARLHEVVDRNLLRCPWSEVPRLYARAREVATQADEKAIPMIQGEMTVDQAVRQSVPKRMLALAFPADDIRRAQDEARVETLRSQWQRAVGDLAKSANQVDATNPGAGLELQRLELRSTQLLSSAPDYTDNADLAKAAQVLREARDRYTFHSRLAAGNLSVEDIQWAFDRLSTIKKDFSQEILRGHVFEDADKALARCAFYFSVAAELSHASFAETCHAIAHKDFVELKILAGDKQQRAYNSWALWLITKTKKELKDREPSFNPMFDYKALASDLFPKVFNRVDDALLNPSVSRLFYELHGKLIDLVKKENELVCKLINEQIFSNKVGIYQLNED